MTTVPLDKIIVAEGRRKIDKKKLESLTESIKELGLINPISVTSDYTLIAGYHRLEAFRTLGKDEIPVMILDLKDARAELAEIDENLIRNELSVLEQAECLKRRKEIYESIHPQTKKGGTHTSNAKKLSADPALSFAKDTESKTGVSERTVQKNVKIATDLAKPVKDKIKNTPIADKKSELEALAKVPKNQQAKVVEKVLSGKAASVREVVEPKKPLTHPAPCTPNHDQFCPQPGGYPPETDLPPQQSLAEQLADQPPAPLPANATMAERLARDKKVLEWNLKHTAPADHGKQDRLDRIARMEGHASAFIDDLLPAKQMAIDEYRRDHPEYQTLADLVVVAIDRMVSGKVKQ